MRKLLVLAAALALLAPPLPAAQNFPPPPMHIALLIDDGPTSEQLEKFLALFKGKNVHATFAFIAKNVQTRPALAQAALAAGHEIANHSFDHQPPAGLSDLALEHEVVGALNVFVTQTGNRPAWYWPPYVAITPDLEKTVAKTTMKIFRPTHLVSSNDWDKATSADQIRTNALNGVTDGSVILFHEWRQETLAQMPAIIAELKKRGAVFLTISELTNHLANNKTPASAPAAP